MQLDLFEDNRPGILLNMAEEHIRSCDIEHAVSVYRQLAEEYPGDMRIAPLLSLVTEWRDLLADSPETPEGVNDLWIRLESVSHPALRRTVHEILCDRLLSMPDPEKIFIPPSFHLGKLFAQLGSHLEAAECFGKALQWDGIPRGRFLVWRGDALTLGGEHDAALKSYLEAFLQDPRTVEMNRVANGIIQRLHISFNYEDEDIDEEDEIAWLPVWGWLCGVFSIPLHSVSSSINAEYFSSLIDEGDIPAPRLWFEMLTYSEHLRTVARNDRELAAVRRLMKRQNRYMFEQYMEKLRVGSFPL